MLDSMASNRKGIIQCPTGGGKTYTMITDSRRFLKAGKVVLIVAPQLLLSQQLFSEFDFHLQDVDFMWRQVSSEGKTFQRKRRRLSFRVIKPEASTTSPEAVRESYRKAQKAGKPLILFTTYASLSRVVESMVPIDVVYFDEAHNCTSSDNFRAVQFLNAFNKYYFTATPKYSEGHSPEGAGMDNNAVYGDFIARVTFDELVSQGVIVRPRIHLQKSNVVSANVDLTVANMAAIVETSSALTALSPFGV
jgi:predicted helicase